MVNAVCEVIPNAEFGLIVLQNPYTGMLELTAATGTGTDRFQLEEDFAPGEGLLGEIFLTGGSRLIQTADMPSRNAHGEFERMTQQRATACSKRASDGSRKGPITLPPMPASLYHHRSASLQSNRPRQGG